MTEKVRPIWREAAVIIGVALTTLTIGYFWHTFSNNPVTGEAQAYPNKFSYLQFARPNEIGDTLAGLAGSLALIWIVVTVWLQATELREQRLEIRGQRQATQKMAESQAAQVKILEKQMSVLASEFQIQNELRTDGLVSILIEELEDLIQNIPKNLDTWVFSGDFIGSKFSNGMREIRLSDKRGSGANAFIVYASRCIDVFSLQTGVDPFIGEGGATVRARPPRTLYHEKIKALLDRVFAEEPNCSPHQRAKISRLGLAQFQKWYTYIFELDELWGELQE